MATCTDPGPSDHASRSETLHATCTCSVTQQYEYRWDELNRISEARRFDRAGTSDWTLEARQRYRYDGANVRVVKESIDTSSGLSSTDSRVALYVYPGDYERRGLVRGTLNYGAPTSGTGVEGQYVVAGARVVWDNSTRTKVHNDRGCRLGARTGVAYSPFQSSRDAIGSCRTARARPHWLGERHA